MNIHSCGVRVRPISRRDMLARTGLGLGAMALGNLLADETHAVSVVPHDSPLSARPPHHPARGKAVISLFMQGGPSQVDTFDPKPELSRLDGKPLPDSFKSQDLKLQFMSAKGAALMGSQFQFQKRSQSGLEISELFSHVAEHADRLAVIRSCYHDSFIHGPALSLMHSGSILLGHPSMGAWIVYGLGCESQNLPAYMVMSDGDIRGSTTAFSSGFLPAVYQGTMVREGAFPIQNLARPAQMRPEEQLAMLEQLRTWNTEHLQDRADDSRLAARIASYELAFRMQSAAPELMDLSAEPDHVQRLYGADDKSTAAWARMLMLARRMVERGVRFVELICADWDGHGECPKNHQTNAARIDKPIAGLLADLAQRGLLDSTLVVWSGEFGRTPIMQGNKGRDHNPYGFSTWLAGAGVRGGQAIGATDELGFRAVEDRIHAHDLHATILGLLGIDHEQLTYLFAGRNRRLTDIGGQNNLAKRLTSA